MHDCCLRMKQCHISVVLWLPQQHVHCTWLLHALRIRRTCLSKLGLGCTPEPSLAVQAQCMACTLSYRPEYYMWWALASVTSITKGLPALMSP